MTLILMHFRSIEDGPEVLSSLSEHTFNVGRLAEILIFFSD